MTCYYGGESSDLEDGAHQILDVLMACYPGHNLKVWGFAGGVFHITHLDFEGGSGWGMALKGGQFYSSSHMRREVISKFGEWLERANLKRGKALGDEIAMVEGIPEKFQPLEYRREQEQKRFDAVLDELQHVVKKEEPTNGPTENGLAEAQ